ncbi:MAG: hypothetical protein Q4P71_03290 [Actinomycetaceae bacterium]|nr:hypothetical protein [Actinomycetaceae bacterium]
MMTWIELGPRLVLMLAAGWIPGLVWVGAVSGFVARSRYYPPKWAWSEAPELNSHTPSILVQLALAPAVTFGMLTVAAFVFSPTSPLGFSGLTWSASTGGTYLAASTTLGLVALGIARGRRIWGIQRRVAIFVTAGVVLATLGLLRVDLNNPLQQWDPAFHANAVWLVVTGADANPLNALSPMFGASASGMFYPSIWHGFVALFSTASTVIPMINLSSIVLIVWWVVGIAALAHVTWGEKERTALAAVVAGLTLAFPADFVSMYAQWPNAISMAFVPGLVAAIMVVGRRFIRALYGAEGNGALAALIAVVLLGCVGAVGAHPIAFFNVGALTVVMTVSNGTRLVRSMYRAGQRGRVGLLLAMALAGVGVFAAVLVHPVTRATAHFERKTSWIDALFHPFTPFPPFPFAPGFVLSLVTMTALTGIGLWVMVTGVDAATSRKATWVPATWAIFAVLVFLAYAPNFGLKLLVGPWYSDPRRLMGIMQVVICLLVTAGLMYLGRLIRARWSESEPIPEHLETAWEAASQWRVGETNWRRFDVPEKPRRSWKIWLRAVTWKQWLITANSTMLALALVLATGFGAIDARVLALRTVYDPEHVGPAGMANTAELDLMRSVSDYLPSDAVIIGDPAQGTVYFQALGNRRVLFPQLSIVDADEDVNLLAWRFVHIHDSPEVCTLLNREGVTHFWAKPDSSYYGTPRSETLPGFYGVDVTRGFTEVARAGNGTLYEITACR